MSGLRVSGQGSIANNDHKRRVEPLSNLVRVGYGPGIVYSKIKTIRQDYNQSSLWALSVDYQHAFPGGMGFVINAGQPGDAVRLLIV